MIIMNSTWLYHFAVETRKRQNTGLDAFEVLTIHMVPKIMHNTWKSISSKKFIKEIFFQNLSVLFVRSNTSNTTIILHQENIVTDNV